MSALPPALRYSSPAELAERVQAERTGRPFLLFRDASGAQRIVDLGEPARTLSIGRHASSDVALEWDSEVSRAHAVLERIGGAWTIVDDGLSRNGSWVNGDRLRGRRRLADGDRILLGRTLVVYVGADERSLRATDVAVTGAPPELSPAQRRVLEELCRPVAETPFAPPASNREIAEALVLSVETVKSHLQVLFQRFGVDDVPARRKRADLVRRAFEYGVLGQ